MELAIPFDGATAPLARERKALPTAREKNTYIVSLARTSTEIDEAQALRYQVFMEEMGASADADALRTHRDADSFDVDCEHLLVRDPRSGQVVGCYRILPPHAALRRGGFYSDREFDLTRINHLRARTAELGRACIHPDFRSGVVLMTLWSGIAKHLHEANIEFAIGCGSIPLGDGHENAVANYKALASQHLAPAEYRVFPRIPYPLSRVDPNRIAKVPTLLKGYARMGAWIGGEPYWDSEFNTADLFILLPMARLSGAYARQLRSA